ncbi:hippocampus abundant transcript 1 protein-like [Dysidea avara]|uniref:hippocampus abundant transcript 1 protein-like n=1 Tax=Dysidea avara TaxID=196820 RepID=UPI00332BAD63
MMKRIKTILNFKKKKQSESWDPVGGYGKPSVYHAIFVIFWEFFAWGLLTSPTIMVLRNTFPHKTFLMNGVIQGIKGILSFLCAPLIGALSDVWGRKSFLLVTVFSTCAPIPLLYVSGMAYFIACALSGALAVTFSIVFSYVADCTDEEYRSCAYGLVSAMFAASLVISPALGTFILEQYPKTGMFNVVSLATGIAIMNLLFIIFIVPESLRERTRKSTWGNSITWEQADPFASLRKTSADKKLLRLCVMVFLSYLPEAGQYSCFFLYLRQVIGFSLDNVSIFIAVLCVMSVLSQTAGLGLLMYLFGHKQSILIGLTLQAIQLFIYGVWEIPWLMWVAGLFAAMSTIIYPSISSLVSRNAEPDQQGVVLGILTGIRGLCNGLGPALYGLLFYMFNVQIYESNDFNSAATEAPSIPLSPPPNSTITPVTSDTLRSGFSGAPFLFGSFLVLLAIIAALFIEDTPSSSTTGLRSRNGSTSKPSSRPTSPLLHNSSIPDREHLFSRTGYT